MVLAASNKTNKNETEQLSEIAPRKEPDNKGILVETVRDLPDLLAPQLIEIRPHFFKVNEVYFVHLYVANLPRRVAPGWLDALLTSNIPYEVDFFLHPDEARQSIGKLQRRRRDLNSTVMQDRQKGRLTSPEVELALDDLGGLIDKLESGNDKLITLDILVTTWGKNQSEAWERAAGLTDAVSRCGADCRKMTLRQQSGFYSLLPDGRNYVRRPKKVDATTVAYTFPFASTDLVMEGGVLFGVNLRENSPVVVNLWKRPDLSNPNVCVVGKSGSGKSFFVKVQALRQLLNGIKLFVIDPENEYDRLAAAAGGRSVYISPSRPFVFNPFELPSTADGQLRLDAINLNSSATSNHGSQIPAEDSLGDPLSEKAATLTSLLTMMILGSNQGDIRGTEGLDRKARDLLDKAIFETYRKSGITRDEIQSGRLTASLLATNTNIYADRLTTAGGPENNSQIAHEFGGPRVPGLADLRDTLLELGDSQGLAGGLERYIGGSFAGFFTNRPTAVTNKDYLTVFKIREVSRELQPLVIAMVMDWCWSLAVRERVPRQFVCDELWSLIASVAGGELVEKFARRSRKLGLSLVVATQQVEDLLGSTQGRAVLANCDTKWIGQQEADHRKILRESLALTEAQTGFVTNTAGAGQALLKCGKRWVPLSVEHSEFEFNLAETNPLAATPI
ncbi:MAG TPA: DUF87 domain-containing protein [Chloroflexia bacterium]|nr:DUF87 domain-containing protein [Chloroflexia bacterium]